MERLEIIEALKDLPKNVEEVTHGLSEDQLRYRPSEGEWSIKEIVGHLRDVAEVWHRRINATATLFDPLFPSFDGEASVSENNYQDANLQTLIAEIGNWRSRTVEVMLHTVDWTRTGQHPELGRRSLKQWGEYMIGHETGHVAHIRSLKASQTTARLPG